MPLRPPNPKKITLADLQTGDVLLSCGDIATNPLDHLITLVDEGDYSHASLVTVELDPPGKPMVIEATTEGIKYETVDVDMGVQMLIVEGLEAWLEKTKAGGKTPMTCVEVITAAYWGAVAVPANKYGLEVELV